MEEVLRSRRHKALVEQLLAGASREELLTELARKLSPEDAVKAMDEAEAEIVSRSSSPYFPETARQVAHRSFSGGYNLIRFFAILLIMVGLGGIPDLLGGQLSIELFNLSAGVAVFAIATWRLRRRMREAREGVDRLIAQGSGTASQT